MSAEIRAAARTVRRSRPRHPAQVVALAFAAAILTATVLLMLPLSTASGAGTGFREALFTATSAVCVTGLVLVDTGSYWSGVGQGIILLAIQAGGFGMMSLASLLGLLVFRRLGLRSRLVAASESKALQLGDIRQVIRGVALTTLVIEAGTALALTLRFWLGYGETPLRAVYLGVFHAVSAFNNAGFALWSDSLTRYATDPFICLPVIVAVILGGIGFPVLRELRRELWTPPTWSLHTKITLLTYGLLVVAGVGAVTALEWRNPGTLGPLGVPGKLLAGAFQGIMPRTAGFNSVDTSQMYGTTWLVTDILMFIGGGSAGTAGGIKVTTFMVLFFVIVAEVRGDDGAEAFGRRLPGGVVRQALSIALLGVALVAGGTLLLLGTSHGDLDRVLFEAVSAFGTVGLSTGITADLPPVGQYVLIGLMFVGRLGPITLASALALRGGRKLYHLPEERPVVG